MTVKITDEKCPYCGSKVKVCVGITSYANSTYFTVYPSGNYIHACLDCGGMYLPEQYRNEIRVKAKLN